MAHQFGLLLPVRKAPGADNKMFEQDVALITGASRGIGQAIAGVLGRAGATVIGTATSAAGAEAISAWLASQGIKGRGIVYRAEDSGAAEAVVAALEGQEGLPTLLVNNAGVARDGLILRMKAEEWDQTLNINLSSVFRLTKVCLKRMLKERRGRIINISSVIGSIGNAGQAHYAASKAGLIGLTRSLAREFASRNITVNARPTRVKSRSGVWAVPRMSRPPCCFWPASRPPTSRARPCMSMAACTWAESPVLQIS